MVVIQQLDLGHFTEKQGFLVFPVAVMAIVYRHRNKVAVSEGAAGSPPF